MEGGATDASTEDRQEKDKERKGKARGGTEAGYGTERRSKGWEEGNGRAIKTEDTEGRETEM